MHGNVVIMYLPLWRAAAANTTSQSVSELTMCVHTCTCTITGGVAVFLWHKEKLVKQQQSSMLTQNATGLVGALTPTRIYSGPAKF